MDTFIDIFFREKYFGHSLAKRVLLAIAMVALAYFGMEYFMGGAQGLAVFVAGALGFVGGAFKGFDWDDAADDVYGVREQGIYVIGDSGRD